MCYLLHCSFQSFLNLCCIFQGGNPIIFIQLWEKVKIPWCKIGAVPQYHELLLHDTLKNVISSSGSEGDSATENQNCDFSLVVSSI
jgi:hypothetical protein